MVGKSTDRVLQLRTVTLMDNTITSQRTRGASQERWSASATTNLYDAEGDLTTDPGVAVKAQVRWRYDAKQRQAFLSCHLPKCRYTPNHGVPWPRCGPHSGFHEQDEYRGSDRT